MNVSFVVVMLPRPLRFIADFIAELSVAALALFMAVYGARLVDVTWTNSIPDFPSLSVGVTYLPIPIGGVLLLLFVIERAVAPEPGIVKKLKPQFD